MKLKKIKIYIGTKTTFESFKKQNILIFYVKDFLSICVKCTMRNKKRGFLNSCLPLFSILYQPN